MPPQEQDDRSSLERVRMRLYEPTKITHDSRTPLEESAEGSLPRAWEDHITSHTMHGGSRKMRFANIFFVSTIFFFLIALGVAFYFFYFGGNTVSVDKITVDIQGPVTIAGGDTVPLLITITNNNPVAIENATVEITFPNGTRKATDVLQPYPRFIENIGQLASGATVTRSIKVVLFGGAGKEIALPVSLSYGTASSNAIFVKKSEYAFTISSTPLSVSVDSLSETVSGKPLSFALTVRSNATVPLHNVVLSGSFPFGFTVDSSSLPLNDSSFLLGTFQPGSTKTVTLTGTLVGQDKEQRVFHFAVGTANTENDQTIAIAYMTQDASITIMSPFLATTLMINGNTSSDAVLAPGSSQSVSFSYVNTLPTSITNATIAIKISGSGIEYDSIRSSSGFYRSSDNTILFSRDTEPALAQLAPGASGLGEFSFSTPPSTALSSSPTVSFTVSVTGTRVGQSNVPEEVTSSMTKIAKIATTVVLSAYALHTSGPFVSSGPIPPTPDKATTYTIVLHTQNQGSAVAGGTVTTILPSYVSYTGVTNGTGSFSYDEKSRTVTWSVGELAQKSSAQRAFQVSLTPSTSQKGSMPALTDRVSFSGHDRFAGVQLPLTAGAVTTDTSHDPGFDSANARVK